MSTTPTSPAGSTHGLLRRALVLVVGAAILVGASSGVAGAKEIGSGGGTVTTTTCNPVSTLGYKGDARAGETGLATITIDWTVKSCTKAAVTAEVQLYLSATPSSVAYADPAARLSGKVTVFGVKANTSYTAKVTVRDAATGAVVGTRSIFAAAVSKGV